MKERTRIAYADPPYVGCAHLYADHPDYAGEVDHAELLERLYADYDGFVLHMSAPSIPVIAPMVKESTRWCSWVKPFAAFKKNVPIAYAWEPVLIEACRKPVVKERGVQRDWISEPITMRRGLTGAKPENVCMWAFDAVGAEADDELIDLFPGTGAVMRAWERWQETEAFLSGDAVQTTLLSSGGRDA